jgi:hypothetical protein
MIERMDGSVARAYDEFMGRCKVEEDTPSEAIIRSAEYLLSPLVMSDGSSGSIDITRLSKCILQPSSVAASIRPLWRSARWICLRTSVLTKTRLNEEETS